MNKTPGRWCAETTAQVQFFDLDPMEVVWHGHYVKYLEVARSALLDKIDYNYPQMRASGYLWPVIDLQVRFAASARFGDVLKLRAEIVEWENRLKIEYLISADVTGKRESRVRDGESLGLGGRALRRVCGCRSGGKNSIDSRQVESAVRPLRPEQTACRLEKAGDI
jgi:acyl-CoA thioester hydrolase